MRRFIISHVAAVLLSASTHPAAAAATVHAGRWIRGINPYFVCVKRDAHARRDGHWPIVGATPLEPESVISCCSVFVVVLF